MSKKAAAKEQFLKIYQQDFKIRMVEIGAEEFYIRDQYCNMYWPDNEEKVHKELVPHLIRFYKNLKVDSNDAKTKKGIDMYLTVLEFYKSKLGGGGCVVM